MRFRKIQWKKLAQNFELYLGTLCFFMLTILLTLQVVSRYVFRHSFTWMEELATILFVWMVYLGVSAAVTYRKHLRIDFVLTMVPFKVKRVMLIASNVVFALFNIYITVIIWKVIQLLGNSQTTMLHLPQKFVYAVIPFALVLSVIRLIQDTIKLTKEDESNIGTSKPSMDLAECERKWNEKKAAKLSGRKGGDN